MARVLALSSQVVRGHVGNSAAVPALRSLGHEVWPLPTVLLSNHPGQGRVAGCPIPPGTIEAIASALAENGWLGSADAVMTGYLPSADHVAAAAAVIAATRLATAGLGRQCLVLVDPVLGDDPNGLYIDPEAAAAIRETLIPQADAVTPNRFELEFLTGRPVTDIADATAALVSLGRCHGVATSIPGREPDSIANVLVSGGKTHVATSARRMHVPHGTGDVLAALFLGHILCGLSPSQSIADSADRVARLIEENLGADDLQVHAWLRD